MTDEPTPPTGPEPPVVGPGPAAEPVRRIGRAPAPRPQIVYLDPHGERPVSPYSPEGEIRMMGEFASGLRRRTISRPVVYLLVLIVLLPIVLSVLAVLLPW